jgi:excisionase family DNA binding protein
MKTKDRYTVDGIEFVDADLCVDMTGLCKQHLYRLAREGKIKAIKVGTKYWYRSDSIEAYGVPAKLAAALAGSAKPKKLDLGGL